MKIASAAGIDLNILPPTWVTPAKTNNHACHWPCGINGIHKLSSSNFSSRKSDHHMEYSPFIGLNKI